MCRSSVPTLRPGVPSKRATPAARGASGDDVATGAVCLSGGKGESDIGVLIGAVTGSWINGEGMQLRPDVSNQRGEGRLVQPMQDVAQLCRVRLSPGEIRRVGFAQGADEGVAVLLADLTVLVAVTTVQTSLAESNCSDLRVGFSGNRGRDPRFQSRNKLWRGLVECFFGEAGSSQK
jgi:hypothetical protein